MLRLSIILTLILSSHPMLAVESFPRIAQYEKILGQFEHKKNTVRLVEVYRIGEEALKEIVIARGESPGLKRFSSHLKRMSGLRVEEGDQGLSTWIDTKYFRKLAEHGSVEDRAFFDLLAKIRPDDIRLLFDIPMTDFGGCTSLGSGALSEVYKALRAYQEKYPQGIYDNELGALIKTTVDAIGDTCICADKEDMPISELKSIIRTFSGSDAEKRAHEILEKLGKKTHKFSFNCRPG